MHAREREPLMILVTGSSGHLGRLVVERLLARVPAAEVVAGARNLDKIRDLGARGVALRVVDYAKPETIAAALAGVDKVLLISGNEPERFKQHQAVVDAAKAAGVKLIAYTSVLKADVAKHLLAVDHIATEGAIRASGVPFVFLRNGWYNENYTESLAATLPHGVTFGAAGNGKVSTAARSDFAEAAAVVLTSEGHAGKLYELAGDRAFTRTEIAEEVARISGKPFAYVDQSEAEYAGTLEKVGVPAGFATMLASSDAGIARGELVDDRGELRALIGHPTIPLADSITAALKA